MGKDCPNAGHPIKSTSITAPVGGKASDSHTIEANIGKELSTK